MLKIANQILDVYDDVDLAGVRKLASINPNAQVMTAEQRAALDDRDFALSVITKKAHKVNKFPIHNASDTWLSNQYFEMNSHKLPDGAQKVAASHIKKACEKFKIRPTRAVELFAKTAASNIFYEDDSLKPRQARVTPDLTKIAAVDDICNNSTHAQYAFATPAHVKVACEYFEQNGEKMPIASRHKYAAAVQLRAKELGMPKQAGLVGKYASDHYSPMVDAHLSARADILQSAEPEIRGTLQKLASLKTSLPPHQFAQALHAFDKRAKLTRYYGSHLTDPYLATFGKEPDAYAGYRHKAASGTELTSEELRKIIGGHYDKISEYFGRQVAEEMKKEPMAIFDSLPNDAKEMIVSFGDGTL